MQRVREDERPILCRTIPGGRWEQRVKALQKQGFVGLIWSALAVHRKGLWSLRVSLLWRDGHSWSSLLH